MKLSWKAQTQELLWGLVARLVHLVCPARRRCWVFAADYGQSYREGSKYLLEYMLAEHSEYTCTFVTRNSDVLRELTGRGIPCVDNFSWRGVLAIARAEAVFFTQYCDDLYFAYPKRGRRYYFLVHGMPYKRAFNAVPEQFRQKYGRKVSRLRAWGAQARQWLVQAFTMEAVGMVSCCSEFNQRYMPDFFGDQVDYPILGMPRNDAFFQPWRMTGERWIEGTEHQWVVTYMPTHRAYGRGAVTPTPFVGRPDVQQWMAEHGALFVMKNHPNMIARMGEPVETPVIRDITRLGIDPQVAAWHSDVLVTDYSSVWMDFLLLGRPIIFYYYDDYEQEDEGLLFSIMDDCPGHVARSEDELFALLRRCQQDPQSMCPTAEQVRKYHKYRDGDSCRRHFDYVSRDLEQGRERP